MTAAYSFYRTIIRTKRLTEPNELTRTTVTVESAVGRMVVGIDPHDVTTVYWSSRRTPYGMGLATCAYGMSGPGSAWSDTFRLVRAPALKRRMLVS